MHRFVNKTEATKFLLPMLGSKKHQDWFFANRYFMDVYIGDTNLPEYSGNIILKYNYHPSPQYMKFERELLTLKNITAEYEIVTKRQVERKALYVFKIPTEFYMDYVKFLQGRYADFSSMYKLRILKFWNIEYDDKHPLMGVLFDGLPWDKPIMDREVHVD